MNDKSWVELCTVSTEIEAELVRSVLESCGIAVLLRASLPTRVYPGLSPVKVLVPEEDLELAEKALKSKENEKDRL
ncbi:MAG: DUF2007 domain-containing protein [Firmicutes bacterium]|nr:DUF2007 domain-containing protein [Candidatus Fermentithermobacillaceae bacterium]